MNAFQPRRIVLATFGTHGDLLPFIGIGRRLQALGHHPVLAASTHHAALVGEHGLPFLPAGPHMEQVARAQQLTPAEVLARAADPIKGGKFIAERVVLPYFDQAVDELAAACQGADLLLAPPSVPWACLAARQAGVPWMSVMLQPTTVCASSGQDPVMLPDAFPLHRLQRLIGARAYRALVRGAQSLSRPWLKPFDERARRLGIYNRRAHPLFDSVFARLGTIALMPPQMLRQPLPDDLPPGIAFAGFSYYQGQADQNAGLPPELARFLARGEAPLVFSLGTLVVHRAGSFYEECSVACERLGLRAVFLTPVPLQRPLPASQIALPWAPHGALFPRSAGVISQGGIGTCAQAARAGVPHLVVPHVNDQPDNAGRLRRLGVALSLPPRKVRGARLERALIALMGDAALRARAQAFAAEINQSCGTAMAARLALQMADRLAPQQGQMASPLPPAPSTEASTGAAAAAGPGTEQAA